MGLRSFTENHSLLILVLFIIGLAGGIAVLSTIFVQGSIFGGASCSFEPVNVSGQQFSSVNDFREAVKSNGGNFSAIQSQVEFRTKNGVLQYKTSDCEGIQRHETQ